MAAYPNCEQAWLDLIEPFQCVRDLLRRTVCEIIVVWGLDEQGEPPSSQEGDAGVHHERGAANSANVAEGITRVFRIPVGIVTKVCLPYPRRAVE
jgi:hypothetical protein